MPPTNPQNAMVRIHNVGPKPFRQKYDGAKYELMPGNDTFIPWDAMCLWFGHPEAIDIPGDKRRRYRSDEVARLRVKYGVYEHHNKWDQATPNIEVFTIAGDRIVTVLDDPEGKQITPESQTVAERDMMARQMAAMQAQMNALMERVAQFDREEAAKMAAGGDTRVDEPESRPEMSLQVTPQTHVDESDVEQDSPSMVKVGSPTRPTPVPVQR